MLELRKAIAYDLLSRKNTHYTADEIVVLLLLIMLII